MNFKQSVMHWPATFCPFTVSCYASEQRQGHSMVCRLHKVYENTYICIYVWARILTGVNTSGIHVLPLHCMEGINLAEEEEGSCIFFSFNLFFILQTMIFKKKTPTIHTNLDLTFKALSSRTTYLTVT